MPGTQTIRAGLAAMVTLVAVAASAGEGAAVREAGDYAVHYNAMPAERLDPELAARYGLPREAGRCVVTVAVVERDSGVTVHAGIMASATRPDGRMHHIEMRVVSGDGGVYYVGDVEIGSARELEFELEVRPDPSMPPQTIRFTRSFASP